MSFKDWFRIAPELPPSTAAGIAPRNVSRMTQAVIFVAGLGFMVLWGQVLMPMASAWLKTSPDACEAIVRMRIMLAPLLLIHFAVLFYVLLDGLRSLQYGQWPWPGMWLWKDTPIRSKTYALWRGRLMLAIGLPVMLGVAGYMTWIVLFGQLLSPEVHAQCPSLHQ